MSFKMRDWKIKRFGKGWLAITDDENRNTEYADSLNELVHRLDDIDSFDMEVVE